MAGITVACSHCGTQLKLKDDSKVGRKAPCPKCKKPFVIKPIDEEAGPDFDLDDDFDEPVEAMAPKSSKKKGAGGKGKSSSKKSNKKSSSGGGLPMPALIGGGVLVLLLGVGGLLWGLGVFGGGGADAPVVANNTPEANTPVDPMEGMGESAPVDPAMEGGTGETPESPMPSNPEQGSPDPAAVANTEPGAGTPATLPSGPPLDLLHPKTELVVHVNVASALKTPLAEQWRGFVALQSGGDPLDAIKADTGLDLNQVESVTFGFAGLAQAAGGAAMSNDVDASPPGIDENGEPVMSGPSTRMNSSAMGIPGVPRRAPPFVAIVRFNSNVDVSTIKGMVEGEPVTDGNITYHRAPPVPDQPAMILSKLDAHHLAVGAEEVLLPILRTPKPWSPALAQRFAQTDFNHTLTLVIDTAILPPKEATPAPTPPDFEQLEQLVRGQTTGLLLAVDVSDSLDVRLGAQANDSQGASGWNSELTRLWAMVPPQLDSLPPFLPEGLKTALTSIVTAAKVESKESTSYLHLSASPEQLQTIATDAQAAAGMLMMMAMANGGGAGISPFGGAPGVEPEVPELSLGERVLLEGVEPTEATGLPEGMVAAGLVEWEVVTDIEGEETIEPVVLVAIDTGDETEVTAYRATEKIPDRRRTAGVNKETTRDEEIADDPVSGVLVKFQPSFSATLSQSETLPNFESQLLLRTSTARHDVVVPNVLNLNGPIDDAVVRPLAMRVEHADGVLKLMYRSNSRVVVGVSKLVSASDDGTAGAASPPAASFGADALPPGFDGSSTTAGAAAGSGVTRTKTETGGNVTISFEGELPADAVLNVAVYPDLTVTNVKFKFLGLSIPPKPESVEALRAAQGGAATGAGGAMPAEGAFNN